MPRSVKTSRVIAEATITPTDIPGSAGDMVTVAVTVPTRGFIHRATIIWGRSSAFGLSADAGGMYLHTACAAGAGAGTTRLTSADAQTIFAQAAVNPTDADGYGGQLEIGSSVFVWAPVLDFAPGMRTALTTGGNGGGPAGVYYDTSGTTLGPTQGTGTIFASWIGEGDINDNAIFCKLRLEIEPVS